MTIAPNKFVALDYELYVGDENERILMEQTTPDRPLEYIQGMGMMLPAFEKQLFGLKAGDKFDFVLKCEDAYGEPSDEAVQELPREIFVDSEGKSGYFQQEYKVYGRQGQPCLQCGGSIEKTVIGQRGTFYCPNCQH